MSELEDLSQRRCSIYPDRPAVAQCPECGSFFSRECIAEHGGRYLCASCIDGLAKGGTATRRGFRLPVVPVAQIVAGSVVVWTIFFLIARLLILIPSEFHEGTIWTK